jgi:cytochrome c oxidase subunit 1
LVGVGSLNDWFAWSIGNKGGDGHFHAKPGIPHWTRYLSFDTNHKVVGIQYGVTSILVLMIGGLFALIFRTELAQPELQILTNEQYNNTIGMHGLLMIVGILLGVGALSNYLMPIMIGAQDMAFPRLNGFSYWIGVPAAILLLLALPLGGFDTGWTAYPPLSVKAPLGMQFVLLSIFVLGFQSIVGSINLLVTIFMMRAPGMTWFRMPIFVGCAGSLAVAIHRHPIFRSGLHFRVSAAVDRHTFLRSSTRRECDTLPAYFLVLLAPHRLYLGTAGIGDYQRNFASV